MGVLFVIRSGLQKRRNVGAVERLIAAALTKDLGGKAANGIAMTVLARVIIDARINLTIA